MPIITNQYLVELNLPTISLGQRYTFLDVPQLRYNAVTIDGIESLTTTQLATSPNQKTVISAANAVGIVLTFVVDETEEIYQIPYLSLNSGVNSGLIRDFANKRINLVKSYATILNVGSIAQGTSLCLNFYYRKNQR